MKYCPENSSCRNHKIRFFTGSLLWVTHSHLLNFWSWWIYLKINSIFWHFLFDWALLAAGCSYKPLELGHGNFLLVLPLKFLAEVPWGQWELVRGPSSILGRAQTDLSSSVPLVPSVCGTQSFASLLAQCGQEGSSQMITVLSHLASFFWLRFWANFGLISTVNPVCPRAVGMGSAAVAPEAATKQIKKSNFPAWAP